MNIHSSANAVVAVLLLGLTATPAQVLISDNYNVTGSGTGFGLGSGANSGINPPATRLGGSLASNMRYVASDASKAATSYSITGNKLQVAAAANSGRLGLSADGTTVYDFGSALTADAATAASPAVYEITIAMANTTSGTARFSFALGTVDNNANFWDFGIQLYKGASADTFYNIGKRIDRVSYTTATDSTGTTADLNAAITTTAAGTAGNQLTFTMRVTDAGAETTTFNSRVQLSMDGGSTWFYDTQTDSALTSGFRFDTANRFFMFDIAANAAVTYDNLSINLITAAPEPSVFAVGLVAGLGLAWRRRSARYTVFCER